MEVIEFPVCTPPLTRRGASVRGQVRRQAPQPPLTFCKMGEIKNKLIFFFKLR